MERQAEGTFSLTQSTISVVVAPGVKTLATPMALELRDIVLGDDPAAEDDDVGGVALLEKLDRPLEERHVRAREHRQAHPVGVLLDGGLHDLLGGLVQAGVDDLHPRVAQGPGDDLGAAVVPVESGLGHHDAQRRFTHGRQPIGTGALGRVLRRTSSHPTLTSVAFDGGVAGWPDTGRPARWMSTARPHAVHNRASRTSMRSRSQTSRPRRATRDSHVAALALQTRTSGQVSSALWDRSFTL